MNENEESKRGNQSAGRVNSEESLMLISLVLLFRFHGNAAP